MEQEKSLDPQLWHACAGSMVQIPTVNSTVFYFAQGHTEHAHAPPDFHAPRVPPLILCRVVSVKFLADSDTDEVFAKITLLPLPGNNDLDLDNDAVLCLTPSSDGNGNVNVNEKPASFAKTLTQSDANNGGGFSVPRYCAETIFPRLDYTAEPPVQTVIAKDIHGETWKFRHIYRGTPRRHLLTTGWSTFVNQKKLIAGDSIVFLRSESGDLCVGIRRAKRGGIGSNGLGSDSPYPGFSGFLRDDETTTTTTSKLMMMKRNGGNDGNAASAAAATAGRVRVEAVAEAVARAACGQAFEAVYYPRASTPEFCVKAADVRSAMRIRWCSGMRFKMAFETEDSSRISWFMGTVSAVQVADPIRWPNSPWRLLQVAWDEPDLLQNVKRVSPWLVELVSNMPAIHLSPFSPRKKIRIPQPFEFPFDGTKFPIFSPGGESMCYLSNDNNNNNAPAGIQGARQAQQLFGSPSPSLLSDLNLSSYSGNKLQSTAMFLSGFNPRHHYDNLVSRQGRGDTENSNNISCSLTMGNPAMVHQDKKKTGGGSVKTHQFLLFGQPILTEQQVMNRKRSLEEEAQAREEKCSVARGLTCNYGFQGLETGHCKVFMESEDVGRTLDLSVIGSYQELYRKLAEMFPIEERSDLLTHVVYRDSNGVIKRIGEEPFSDFMRATKRLTIKMDIGGDNVRKTWITGIRNGENGIDASTKTGPLSIFA
ncbi:PREDICTED: auxin response factor 10-like [Camelina sativa]|uniref:Auxin response factor n=1 Tax=Camelina sativa TaxID=90675 RepID=A0ABM0SQ93_CAMSA|nr:PREDICTED: auxin response factor 10-like [Camelina sativa]